MSTITPSDVKNAQGLYDFMAKADKPRAELEAMARTVPAAKAQVDLFLALSSIPAVKGGAPITERHLSRALESAGVTLADVGKKMGSCPVGAQRPPIQGS